MGIQTDSKQVEGKYITAATDILEAMLSICPLNQSKDQGILSHSFLFMFFPWISQLLHAEMMP